MQDCEESFDILLMSYGSGIKYLLGQGYQTNRLVQERAHKIGKMMCIAFLPLTEIILNTVEALISTPHQDTKKVCVNRAGHLQEWFSGPL